MVADRISGVVRGPEVPYYHQHRVPYISSSPPATSPPMATSWPEAEGAAAVSEYLEPPTE